MSDESEARERRLLASYKSSGEFLYNETIGKLVRIAASHGLDAGQAEDVAQDAIHTLFDRRPPVERPEAWLQRVVARRCIDLRRKLRAESRALERERSSRPAVAEIDSDPWRDRRLLDACRALPPKAQILIRARYVGGHDEATSARLAGYSIKSFKKVMSRALKRLREAMGERAPDEPPVGGPPVQP